MAHHNVYTFFSVHNCLDEDFDAPDEADREVCRAIVAGRMGLHPDGWSNHDPQPLRWLLRRRRERDLPGFGEPLPVDPEWEAKHRRRPVEAEVEDKAQAAHDPHGPGRGRLSARLAMCS